MNYLIDENILQELRDRVDIVELVGRYVDLKKRGANYLGLCPFHNEKTPSFTVSEQKEIFHCFGCGVGGDVISFLMKIENLSFVDAVVKLASMYNIKLEEKSPSKKSAYMKRGFDANREAAVFFMENLSKNKFALTYLHNRGISTEVILKYGLGFAKDSWNDLLNHMLKKGYTEKELLDFNLISKNERSGNYYDRFRNRIIFPIIDVQSRVLGFGGRVLDNSLPKYLNTGDTLCFNKGNNLYSINIIAKESSRKRILLVEGYMDVISLYSVGINYSVASLGTALTKEQAKVLKKYSERVYICYDGDDAGIKATNRAIDVLLSEDIKPLIVSLPEKLDPDEYIKKYGAFSFESQVVNAKNYLDYKVENIEKNFNIESFEGKSKFIGESVKVISSIVNPIEKEVYIDRFSEKYSISKDAINRELENIYATRKPVYNNFNKPIKQAPPTIQSGRLKAEFELLKIAYTNRKYFKTISTKLNSGDFSTPDSKVLFDKLEEYYQLETDLPSYLRSLVKNNLIDEGSFGRIERILKNNEDLDTILLDLVYKIKHDNLLVSRNNILKAISDAENSNVPVEELLINLEKINRDLRKLKEELS